MRTALPLACFVGAAAALLHARSQQPPPRYNETVNVNSVLIDVRVLDDAGRAIPGLRASDFSVKIDGKPVHVQSSTWIAGVEPPALASPAPPALRVASGAPLGRLIVLLFQRSLTKEHAWGLVRKLAESRNLVRSLDSTDRVAILSFDTSLKIWSDFTTDRAALDHILARGILYERPPVAEPLPPPSPSLLARLDTNTGKTSSSIERAFELIAYALEPLPGSKTIAFIGHSMGAINRYGDQSGEKRRASAIQALTAARAAVFSLDITNADSHSLAIGLQQIAEGTGGFYASSLDFPERPMQWLEGALSGYYVLFVDKPDEAVKARGVSVSVTSRQAHVFAKSAL